MLAVLAGGAVAAAATSAQAGPADELHVAVHAPLGKGCISGDRLKVAVQKHVGDGARRRTVDVRIATNDPEPGWSAEVAVAGRAGTRVVRTQSTSCNQLDDGLVLVITLLLDPEEKDPPGPAPKGGAAPDEPRSPGGGSSWGTEPPGGDAPADEEPHGQAKDGPGAKGDPGAGPDVDQEPEQETPDAPAADAGDDAPGGGGDRHRGEKEAEKGGAKGDKGRAGAGAGGDEDEDRSGSKTDAEKDGAGKREGEEKKKVRFGIGAGFAYTVGLLPAGLPGARLSFAWMAPGPFPFEASYTYNGRIGEYKETSGVGWTRELSSMTFEVQACPLGLTAGWLHLTACGGLASTYVEENVSASYLTATPDFPENTLPLYSHQEQLMLSPTAELRADMSLLSWLRVRAGFGGMVAVNPMSSAAALYSYSDQKLTEPVIFRGQLGIEVVLPP